MYRSREHAKSPVGGGQNDQTLMNLIDSQQREIESYRQAMKRMGEEVIKQQDALTRLEADNSRLRQQANMYEDTTRAMVTDAKLEGMSKAEMLEKYGKETIALTLLIVYPFKGFNPLLPVKVWRLILKL